MSAAGTQLFANSFEEQLEDLISRICEKLQISKSSYEQAEERYHAIGELLSSDGSGIAKYRPLVYAQGSMAIGTTLKPVGRDEFDIDLVCEFQIDPRPIEDPVRLLHAVEFTLAKSGRYKGMIERKDRCIRISYANDFHLDILPACPDVTAAVVVS